MEGNPAGVFEIFNQSGVFLKSAPACYLTYFNTTGILSITEYLNSNQKRCIEWKANDITADSDAQDQEWDVVNVVERRTRTQSESQPPDGTNRSKYLRVDFSDIKSFKVSRSSTKLTFYDGKGEALCTFEFKHGNCDGVVSHLRALMRTAPTKRDKHIFIVLDNYPEAEMLDKSFAGLNLFAEEPPHIWKFLKTFQESPYTAGLEAFAKISDIVVRSREHREMDDNMRELLDRSIHELEGTTTTQSQDEYEVVTRLSQLPERKNFPRGKPITAEQWRGLQDHEGRVEDVDSIKLVIFRGGVTPSIRHEVWKYLLGYYPWESTQLERQQLMRKKKEEYFTMKLQWKSMTKIQEDHFSDYREKKSLIEKDVNRTDRTMDFYAGENNTNLQLLNDILVTYVMYNFDLGYVQGMSDLLSPILYLLRNEVDAFWCFAGFMSKVEANFDVDQAGMKEQLQNMHTLLAFVEPELASYLVRHESGNMFFCFRWLLVWFKRELSLEDSMRLWEVLWTGLPCQNFHLLFCVAILETEKQTLTENNYGFTEILRHINDLCGNIDVAAMLNKAEGIFHQIKEAEHLTNEIRLILGLPIVLTSNVLELSDEIVPLGNSNSSNGQRSRSPDEISFGVDSEVTYERSISNTFL